MGTVLSKIIVAFFPFIAAFFVALVFVRILGFDFVVFSNWYLTFIVALQTFYFLGVAFVGVQNGRLDALFLALVMFFAMSGMVLAGLSAFQLWSAVPFTPNAFSVVANYQNEVVRLTGEGIKLGYDPQFQNGLQREVTFAVVFGLINLLLNFFIPRRNAEQTSQDDDED